MGSVPEDGEKRLAAPPTHGEFCDGPRIFITGFGPFGSVKHNPTTTLCEALATDIRNGPSATIPIVAWDILDVSKRVADEYCSSPGPTENDIVIHLGVCEGSDRIMLETRGANNMCFPIPDVDGVTPTGDCINTNAPDFIYSSLPVKKLMQIASSAGVLCDISEDAGTYLCNYIYFQSLSKRASRRVLFVHVPPFRIMSEEEQLEGLNLLLESIRRLETAKKL